MTHIVKLTERFKRIMTLLTKSILRPRSYSSIQFSATQKPDSSQIRLLWSMKLEALQLESLCWSSSLITVLTPTLIFWREVQTNHWSFWSHSTKKERLKFRSELIQVIPPMLISMSKVPQKVSSTIALSYCQRAQVNQWKSQVIGKKKFTDTFPNKWPVKV